MRERERERESEKKEEERGKIRKPRGKEKSVAPKRELPPLLSQTCEINPICMGERYEQLTEDRMRNECEGKQKVELYFRL